MLYNEDLRINKMIRKIMIDRDVSMTQVGTKMGMTQQGISRQLNHRNVNIDQLCKLANCLGCDIHISCVDQSTGEVLDTVTLNTHID